MKSISRSTCAGVRTAREAWSHTVWRDEGRRQAQALAATHRRSIRGARAPETRNEAEPLGDEADLVIDESAHLGRRHIGTNGTEDRVSSRRSWVAWRRPPPSTMSWRRNAAEAVLRFGAGGGPAAGR